MLIPFLTYLLFFVVPLVVIPGFALRFEPPKVLISELLIEVLAVYLIASGKFSFKRINKTLGIFVGGLFLLSLGHLILSPTEKNLFGNVFRLQGTILFWHLLMLAIVAQNYYFRFKEKYIFIASFLAICAGVLIYGTNSAGRWIGSLGEPNAFGAVAILVFPFVFLSFKSIWVRIISILGVVGVLNFSQSKSAVIALGLQLLFIMLIKITKGKYILASIICFILLGLSLALPILEHQYFLMTNNNPFNFRFEDRSEIWNIALNAGMKSPIYGSGWESIQGKIQQTAREMNVNSQYLVIDSSHNFLLDYWIWGGLTGLSLLLVLCGIAVKNMINKKMKLELVIFLALLTVLSFNPTTVSILAAFWWVIGRSFIASEELDI